MRTAPAVILLLDALKVHGPQSPQQLADRLAFAVPTVRRWLVLLERWELATRLVRRSRHGRGHNAGGDVWDVDASLGIPCYAQSPRLRKPARAPAKAAR